MPFEKVSLSFSDAFQHKVHMVKTKQKLMINSEQFKVNKLFECEKGSNLEKLSESERIWNASREFSTESHPKKDIHIKTTQDLKIKKNTS